MKRMLAAAVFSGALLSWTLPLNADETIKLSVFPTVAVSHGNAQLRVFVERNDANRALTWEVDGPDYYRSSSAQLDGSAAPRSWFFFVRDLPSGTFDVRATVTRDNRSQSMAQTKIIVLGPAAR